MKEETSSRVDEGKSSEALATRRGREGEDGPIPLHV